MACRAEARAPVVACADCPHSCRKTDSHKLKIQIGLSIARPEGLAQHLIVRLSGAKCCGGGSFTGGDSLIGGGFGSSSTGRGQPSVGHT
jgi:hypothetical protein